MPNPRQRANEIDLRLAKQYPGAKVELDFTNPFELLIATILAAQSTDVRINIVTKSLFRKYPAPEAFAKADLVEMETDVKQTGFFRNKAKAVINCSKAIVERHGGEVPRTIEELTELPGVGRKTANVVLGNAMGINAGIVVDTHVTRLSGRLGLTKHADPEEIEHDLMKLVPRERWTSFANQIILHGRRVCIARKPLCPQCVLSDICPSAQLEAAPAGKAAKGGPPSPPSSRGRSAPAARPSSPSPSRSRTGGKKPARTPSRKG